MAKTKTTRRQINDEVRGMITTVCDYAVATVAERQARDSGLKASHRIILAQRKEFAEAYAAALRNGTETNPGLRSRDGYEDHLILNAKDEVEVLRVRLAPNGDSLRARQLKRDEWSAIYDSWITCDQCMPLRDKAKEQQAAIRAQRAKDYANMPAEPADVVVNLGRRYNEREVNLRHLRRLGLTRESLTGKIVPATQLVRDDGIRPATLAEMYDAAVNARVRVARVWTGLEYAFEVRADGQPEGDRAPRFLDRRQAEREAVKIAAALPPVEPPQLEAVSRLHEYAEPFKREEA